MALMMLIMPIICLLKTLNKCIRLAECFCSINYVQPYGVPNFWRKCAWYGWFQRKWLFPSWFQVMPLVSWLVSYNSYGFIWFQVVLDGFRSFHQVVPLFSKSIDFLGEKVQFSRDVSWKFCELRRTEKIMSQLLY